MTYHNIESRPRNGKRLGYAASTGQAIRIYSTARGYLVAGHRCRTLADVSAYLVTL